MAEISGNHKGDKARALELIKLAATSGATHVKFQTYSPDRLTFDGQGEEYRVVRGHPLWSGRTLYDLYTEGQTPFAWHADLFREATKLDLVPFSAPFDEISADFLEELGTSVYKIASLEIVDLPLIRHVAAFRKPMIISTGGASVDEISEAYEAARSAGASDVTLLLCTSDYPADPLDANLARLSSLKSRFGCSVGVSDHSLGSEVAVLASALGATVIEKHLTISRSDGALDSGFSSTPDEFREMVSSCTRGMKIVGSPYLWSNPREDNSRGHRPSLIATKTINVGEKFSLSNVDTLRPNIGMSPKHLDAVLGRVAKAAIHPGEGIVARHVEGMYIADDD